MLRHSDRATSRVPGLGLALTLALVAGMALAPPAAAQEVDGDPGRPDPRDDFQRPREDGPRPREDFQRPREDGPRPDARAMRDPLPPATFAAPVPPAPPSPPMAGPDPRGPARPEAWGRYGQPRDVQPDPRPDTRPPPRPDSRPDSRPDRQPDRDGDRRDQRRYDDYRNGGYGSGGYRPDRYWPDGYRPNEYRPDGYGPDGYRPDGYRPGGSRPPPHPGGRPPRYDPRWYPPVWTPPYRYRADRWAAPPGYAYRRWSYGEVLPWTWWTPRYRIDSWWTYGLPIPPVGYTWVRLGRDAVLVDLWTGRIVQVACSLFW